MASCKSCGSPIRWVAFESGKRAPLDALPKAEGTIRILRANAAQSDAEVLFGGELQLARDAGEKLYLSHFATCPNAKQHRKTAGAA